MSKEVAEMDKILDFLQKYNKYERYKIMKVLITIVILFIPLLFISGNEISINNDGRTLYVGGSGENNYTSIQEAIDDAMPGDTIFVYSGIYYEHIRIYKSISLIGENEETTIIDGRNENAEIFKIEANNVKFSHFTIRNIKTQLFVFGISVTGDNITISNCTIKNADGLKAY